MGKIGRNDPCFCGSGKKYKKCCLNRKDIQVVTQDYPPTRVELPTKIGEIRKLPNNLQISNPTNVKDYSKKISSIFEDQSIIDAIGWDKKITDDFSKKLLSYSTKRTKIFDVLSTDPLLFKTLLLDIKYQKHANSIYWNEIDQYIYQYKCNTHNLICDRISKAIDYFNDHLTFASIIRQIIELVINAIANQWVITRGDYKLI